MITDILIFLKMYILNVQLNVCLKHHLSSLSWDLSQEWFGLWRSVSDYHIFYVKSGIKLYQFFSRNSFTLCWRLWLAQRHLCRFTWLLKCFTCGKWTFTSGGAVLYTHLDGSVCSGAQSQRSGIKTHICIQLGKLIIPLNRQWGCTHTYVHTYVHTHF